MYFTYALSFSCVKVINSLQPLIIPLVGGTAGGVDAVEIPNVSGKTFAAIDASAVAGLNWQTPTPQAFTATTTIVFRRNGGNYLKIGHMTMNLNEGTITFAYADVTP